VIPNNPPPYLLLVLFWSCSVQHALNTSKINTKGLV